MNTNISIGERYELLCRGRSPSAMATLKGTVKNKEIEGSVCFYSTPIGMVINARISGLDRCSDEGIYRFGFYTHSKDEDRRIKSVMPIMYEREGRAWGSSLTSKMSVSDFSGRVISLYSGREAVEVAFGKVE